MSISNTDRVAGPYTGNGVATAFPFEFKVFQRSDVLVALVSAAGAESVLVLDSDYTVTLNADQDVEPGGTVTLSAALATGATLTVTSQVPATQPVVLTNFGAFLPAVINGALDRLTILVQQALGLFSRSLQVPASETGSDLSLPGVPDRAGKLLAFDSLGRPTVAAPVTDSATEVRLDLGDSEVGKGGSLVRLQDGRTVQEVFANLAGPNGGEEVGTSVHTFSKVSQALSAIDWAQQEKPAGVNVLRYVPVSEWAAIIAGTSTYDIAPALQSALNSGAGTVYLPQNGVVKMRGAVDIPSNTTLDLNGCKVVRDTELTNLFRNKSDGITGGYGASKNISIINGVIDVNGVPSAFSLGQHQTNCTPIGFHHATNVQVRGVEIYGTKGWHPIEFNACRDAVAAYNYIHHNDQALVTAECIQIDASLDSSTFPWFGPYDGTPCDGVTIYRNRFTDNTTAIGTHSATTSVSNTHKRIKIKENIFLDLIYPAIRGLNWTEVEIIGNTAENCCRYQGGGDYATFEFGTSDNAFLVSHYKVNGNTIKRAGGGNPGGGALGIGRGINFYGDGLKFFIVHVNDNTVENCARHGVTMDCVGSGSISKNTVTGCAGTGIWGYRVNRMSITGNTAYGNASAAGRYDMAMGGGGAPDNCVVDGNTVGTYSTLTASASLVVGDNRIGV